MNSPSRFRVRCPNLCCRRLLAVPKAARGHLVRCRHCTTTLRVPGIRLHSTEGSPIARVVA
ncbi:MAG: hypothetical protein MK116_08260 [Phycisphaerales bacterium]|nr:hypothetical protein [Phycisphaerales bacterium]